MLYATWRAVIDRFRGAAIGGRSMGGRYATMVMAGTDGLPAPAGVLACVLLAYPLHPPGKPERLRVEHLTDVTVPCLFVQGTRDPFASRDLADRHLSKLRWIEGAGHDLKRCEEQVAAIVADFLQS